MKKNLLQRIIIIAVVTLVGLWIVLGPRHKPTLKDFTVAGVQNTLRENIHLGLDLRGGSHLVMQVQVPDYLKRLTESTAITIRQYSNLLRELVGRPPDDAEPPMEPELLSYLIAAALNLQVPEKQSLLAEPRTDARLTLELRMLRKEIVLLKQMVAHAGTAAKARTSLN